MNMNELNWVGTENQIAVAKKIRDEITEKYNESIKNVQNLLDQAIIEYPDLKKFEKYGQMHKDQLDHLNAVFNNPISKIWIEYSNEIKNCFLGQTWFGGGNTNMYDAIDRFNLIKGK